MQQPLIMVTGASGLVGVSVIQYLIAQRIAVVAVVRRLPPPLHPVYHPLVRLVELALVTASEKQIRNVFEQMRPTALIHCAALVNADLCEKQRALTHKLNVEATRMLSAACALTGTDCVFVSTDYVYGGKSAADDLYREDDPVHPLSVYGQSKWQGELAVQELCTGRTSWSIARTSVVYGSSGWSRPDFLHWLAQRLGEGEPVQIVNDQISSMTCVEDLAEMLVALALQRAGGIYHTAGSSPMDRYRFARAFAQFLELDASLIAPVSTQELGQVAVRPFHVGLCISKIEAVLGRSPWSAAKGIAHCWQRECVGVPDLAA